MTVKELLSVLETLDPDAVLCERYNDGSSLLVESPLSGFRSVQAMSRKYDRWDGTWSPHPDGEQTVIIMERN